jgi:rsbT antagonist protein RsbS
MKTFENRIPVIQLWQRIVVPLQGDVTDETAAFLVDDVLQTIRDTSAAGLVIDVTGMWTMDSHLCHVIANLAAAARLMGTPTVICGMSAPIAMTLQTMGADFRLAQTALTLEDALERLGVNAIVNELEPDDDDDDISPEALPMAPVFSGGTPD